MWRSICVRFEGSGHRLERGHITGYATQDLKLNKLTPADIGQMNFYLNYAQEHWTRPDENPPVGLILCADHGGGVAKYALPGLPSKVLTARYRTALPSEAALIAEIDQTRKMLERRHET